MLLKDFITFLFKPEYLPTQDLGGSLQSAWATFRIWTLVFLISWLGIPISLFISKIYGTSFADHAGYEYAADRTLLQVVWGAVLFFPVWEELVFRLGLKFSRLNLSVGLAAFTVYISRLLFPILRISRPSWLFSPDSVTGILSIVIPVIVLAAMIWLALAKIRYAHINQWYQRGFRIVFYVPLLTFAFLHALNSQQELWIFAPLITLPQICLAAGLGYIRIKYGIVWSGSTPLNRGVGLTT